MFHPLYEHWSSEEQLRHHAELIARGFTVLHEFAPPSLVRTIHADLTCVRDSDPTPRLLTHVDLRSDMLYDLARHDVMMRIGEGLLGTPVMPLRVDWIVDRRSSDGQEATPMQDRIMYDGHFDEPALAVCIALDDMTGGTLPEFARPALHAANPLENDRGDSNFENLVFAPCPMSRGDAVIYSAETLHRSLTSARAPGTAVIFRYRASPYRLWLRNQQQRHQGRAD